MGGGNKTNSADKPPTGQRPHFRERRRWKRKDVSAQGRMRIINALDQKQSSRWMTILINDISAGGIRAQTPSISWDDLHVVGDLTKSDWTANILDLEMELPVAPAQNIFFEGSARWYSRIGVGPDHLIGIHISYISEEDNERLLDFLGQEGI